MFRRTRPHISYKFVRCDTVHLSSNLNIKEHQVRQSEDFRSNCSFCVYSLNPGRPGRLSLRSPFLMVYQGNRPQEFVGLFLYHSYIFVLPFRVAYQARLVQPLVESCCIGEALVVSFHNKFPDGM